MAHVCISVPLALVCSAAWAQAPSIRIDGLKEGDSVRGTVEVKVKLVGDVGEIEYAELQVDGKTTTMTGSAPWTLKWKADRSGGGEHTIKVVVARKAGGNLSSKAMKVIVGAAGKSADDSGKSAGGGKTKPLAVTMPKIGEPAPDFTLKDLKGKDVKLSDFKGKVVLLSFFASWCPPCQTEAPELEKLHLKYKDKGFVLIALNNEVARIRPESFAKVNKLTYLILLNAQAEFQRWGIVSIPTTYYLDRKGIIRGRDIGYGPGREKQMEAKIVKLLATKGE